MRMFKGKASDSFRSIPNRNCVRLMNHKVIWNQSQVHGPNCFEFDSCLNGMLSIRSCVDGPYINISMSFEGVPGLIDSEVKN